MDDPLDNKWSVLSPLDVANLINKQNAYDEKEGWALNQAGHLFTCEMVLNNPPKIIFMYFRLMLGNFQWFRYANNPVCFSLILDILHRHSTNTVRRFSHRLAKCSCWSVFQENSKKLTVLQSILETQHVYPHILKPPCGEICMESLNGASIENNVSYL